ncbi:hypothetical protein GQX73_g7585 [Xylaria multiplex]|uniref:Uncharacterized protein n=1 Tax=Xylaria multiplex TaxID=323545 RepID=A0A7C8MR62_9PEZI|nr:hypothetical protein GQX73_g7585 [Xylaria multiplex]
MAAATIATVEMIGTETSSTALVVPHLQIPVAMIGIKSEPLKCSSYISRIQQLCPKLAYQELIAKIPKAAKCRPEARRPGQKCDLCIEKGRPCSNPETAKEEREKRSRPGPNSHLTGEGPRFKDCIILLIRAWMFSSIHQVVNDIEFRFRAGNRAHFVNIVDRKTPKILDDSKLVLSFVRPLLCALIQSLGYNPKNPVDAVVLKILDHPKPEGPTRDPGLFLTLLDQLSISFGEREDIKGQNHCDHGCNLTSIEQRAKSIHTPTHNWPKGSDGINLDHVAIRYLCSVESVWAGASGTALRYPYLFEIGELFVHDFWYQQEDSKTIFLRCLRRLDEKSILQKDSLGRTILHFVVENMVDEPPAFSPEDLALLDATDAFKRTALHIACAYNGERSFRQILWVRELLEHQAKTDLRDAWGRLARDYAVIDGRQDILEAFQEVENIDTNKILEAMREAEEHTRKALAALAPRMSEPSTDTEE